MLKTNFLISLRNLLRYKLISLINILGLATGIASCIIIFLFINYESKFDKHQSKYKQIRKLFVETQTSHETELSGATPFPLGEAIRLNMNDVEHVVRMFYSQYSVAHIDEKKIKINNVLFADTNYFDVFDTDWIKGSKTSFNNDFNSVIISESFKEKVFGNKSCINEIIDIDHLLKLKIVGVVKDQPTTSSLPFDILIPMERLTNDFAGIDYNRWTITWDGFMVFVSLPHNIRGNVFDDKLNDLIKDILPSEGEEDFVFSSVSLEEVHFTNDPSNYTYSTKKSVLWILAVIGILILLVASINYINLSIPQVIKRSKEIGVRKVIGAENKKLFYQFLSETLFVVLIANIVAFLLIEIMLPYINNFLGNNINLSLYNQPIIFLYLVVLLVIIVLITGIYPAYIISLFNPIQAIRNKITTHHKGNKYLKNSLIIAQILIAQILIVCSIIISKQVQYFYNKDLGFDPESVICLPIPDIEKRDVFKNQLLANPNISNVSFGGSPPLAQYDNRFTSYFRTRDTDEPEEYQCEIKAVDENYLETFNLRLLHGEWIPEGGVRDSAYCIIVNEALTRSMGISNPADVVGRRINMGRIIGVLEDFHLESLHNKIEPMVMFRYAPFFGMGFIKVNANSKETLSYIENEWIKLFPDEMFEHWPYNEYISEMYKEETKIFDIIKIFSLLAIIIACLGMFGMISFLLIQKEKEISIRKIFGANISKLFTLLSRDYLIYIIIANIIAFPLSLYAMRKWLENYAYRIEIDAIPYIIGITLTIILTFLTISYQIIKASQVNPVEALKYE